MGEATKEPTTHRDVIGFAWIIVALEWIREIHDNSKLPRLCACLSKPDALCTGPPPNMFPERRELCLNYVVIEFPPTLGRREVPTPLKPLSSCLAILAFRTLRRDGWIGGIG